MRMPRRPAPRQGKVSVLPGNAEPSNAEMTERMEVHKNAVEYSKQATQYMFYANGTALTTLLINFDVGRHLIPMLIFGVGIVFSIMIPIVLFARCSASLTESDPETTSLIWWHKSILLRYFSTFAMWFPALFFLYGLCATVDCFNGVFPRSPLQLLQEVLKTLIYG